MRGGTGYDGPDGGAVAFDDERVDRVSDLRDVHLPWRWGRLPLLGDDALRRRVVEQATWESGSRPGRWTTLRRRGGCSTTAGRRSSPAAPTCSSARRP